MLPPPLHHGLEEIDLVAVGADWFLAMFGDGTAEDDDVDHRGEKHACETCGTKWWDLNKGLRCPKCHPKPAAVPETPAEETNMSAPIEATDERREKIRKLLSKGPMRMMELVTELGATAPTIRTDLLAMGAAQQGNRTSPWELPGDETPVAEEAPATTLDPRTLSAADLAACITEGRRRIAEASEVERIRAAFGDAA